MEVEPFRGRLRIPLSELQAQVAGPAATYPKYATQLMNLANSNAQGTRPSVVGQLSQLIGESGAADFEAWVAWYREHQPDAIDRAVERVWKGVEALQKAVHQIDPAMVRRWVLDLVLAKTFVGFRVQQAILPLLAKTLNLGPVRAATPADEAQGIDGYLGTRPVSVKPESYRAKPGLLETIQAPIVFYEKGKTHLEIDASRLYAALGR